EWRVVLVCGLLALFVTLLLQPLFLWGSVEVRSHTDLQAVRDHILRAYDQGVLAGDGEPAQFIHRGGHSFTECIAMVVALDNQMDLVRSVVFPTVHDIYHRAELLASICAELRDLGSG